MAPSGDRLARWNIAVWRAIAHDAAQHPIRTDGDPLKGRETKH